METFLTVYVKRSSFSIDGYFLTVFTETIESTFSSSVILSCGYMRSF